MLGSSAISKQVVPLSNIGVRSRVYQRLLRRYAGRLYRKVIGKFFLWRLPIAYKMAIGFSLVIVLGMGALGVVVIQSQESLMRRQMSDYGITIVDQYAAGATDAIFTDDQLGMQVLTVNLVSNSRIEGAALYSQNGDKLAAQGQVPLSSLHYILGEGEKIDTRYRMWEWQYLGIRRNPGMASFLAPVSFKNVTAGYALITFSREDVNFGFHQTIRTLAVATVMMMVISIIIAYIMSRRIANPIVRIVAATDALGRGDYQIYIKERRGDELGRLNDAVNRMAENMREKHQVEGVLTRLVSSDVAKEMLSDLNDVGIGSVRVEATVLFVDIVGFTSLSEQQKPEAVVELLNEYFGYFTQCSQHFFGSVDKFIGDCAMVIFGVPREDTNHRFNAISCAVLILRLFRQLNRKRKRQGKVSIEVRIGINTGEMMAGMIGTRERMEYTVIGDPVNIASRISSLAEPGSIVVGEEVLNQADLKGKVAFEPLRDVKVRGKSIEVSTYCIINVAARYLHAIDNIIANMLSAGEPK